MKIPLSKVEGLLAELDDFQFVPRRIDIDETISELRLKLVADAENLMQPCVLLLDESVQFFVHLEELFRPVEEARPSAQFYQLVCRLRSDVVAIRAVILLGQAAPAEVLCRAFVESIEICMATLIDQEFSTAYGEAEDVAEFWRKQIAYGKVHAYVERFFVESGVDLSDATRHISYMRAVKSALSSATHASPSSALFSSAYPSLASPGYFHVNLLGCIDANLPRLCLLIAHEIWMFSSGLINLLVRGAQPLPLSDIAPCIQLSSAIASAHVLQGVMTEYGDELYEFYEAIRSNEG